MATAVGAVIFLIFMGGGASVILASLWGLPLEREHIAREKQEREVRQDALFARLRAGTKGKGV